MGMYRELHIYNLKRHKKFYQEGVKKFTEQLIKINKELKRYEKKGYAMGDSEFRALRGPAMVGLQGEQAADKVGRK